MYYSIHSQQLGNRPSAKKRFLHILLYVFDCTVLYNRIIWLIKKNNLIFEDYLTFLKYKRSLCFIGDVPYPTFALVRDIPVCFHSVYDLPCFKIGQAKATLQVRDTNLPVFLCYPYCLFVVRHPFATAGVLAPLSTNRQSLSGIFLFSI